MKIGIIGLPQTGKKTLFQTLTGNELREQSGPAKPIPGNADIIDDRFDRLVNLYSPKSSVRAKIELVLLPKLEKENIAKGAIFKDIADVDAICHVIRAFEDEAVYHADGSVDPLRDMEMVGSELLMHDQIFVEKRIERIELAMKKKKDEQQEKELILLRKMLEHLEGELPLRLMEISDDDELLIKSYPFITQKELILAFNVSEDDLGESDILAGIKEKCAAEKMEAMVVSAQVESEIALLDSEEERQDFLGDLGIEEAALGMLTRLCLKALGLVSFFTVGEDEVRVANLGGDDVARLVDVAELADRHPRAVEGTVLGSYHDEARDQGRSQRGDKATLVGITACQERACAALSHSGAGLAASMMVL